MGERQTVAVVGAGFSGSLTALRLLVAPAGPRVLLIERGARFGRGAAYSTSNARHLLNVRATNMSAFVEQPAHFIEWLKANAATGDEAPETTFVTRDLYGQYLQSLLRRAASQGVAADRLELEHDEVVAVERDGDRWRLGLGLGRSVIADVVVLALGNLPPSPPAPIGEALAASGAYAADPWAWDPATLPSEGDVLLLGSGLTAVDVALSVYEQRPGARVMALSRHGLLPARHAAGGEAPAFGPPPKGSPSAVLAEVRRRAGADWRAAIDALRPQVHAIWRGWSLAEKRRFLRHLRPFWDLHRHRMAPAVAEEIDRGLADGTFEVVAGRLVSLTAVAGGLEACWVPKGGGKPVARRFSLAVNCVGPRGEVAGAGDALIGQLLGAGLIRPDACDLGLDVDARSRVIGADGEASETLFAVGPITRGQFYEITSVPDIRIQAADCAGAILNALALRDHAPSAGGGQAIADLAAFVAQSIDELDVELASLKYTRRVRNAWELRGRRAALGEIALWLDGRKEG
jgi:uncharacterized NAD(P)/FAD-binding protein YdhS